MLATLSVLLLLQFAASAAALDLDALLEDVRLGPRVPRNLAEEAIEAAHAAALAALNPSTSEEEDVPSRRIMTNAHVKRQAPLPKQRAAKLREANARHCDGAADAQALTHNLHTFLAGSPLPHPKVHVQWPTLDTLDFTVVLPYVPAGMRYALAFEPIDHDPEIGVRAIVRPTRCSSFYGATSVRVRDSVDEPDDFDTSENFLVGEFGSWDFAPNAKFPGAFDERDEYPANYVSEESLWTAEPEDCAHVRYTARFSLEELAACRDAIASMPLGSDDSGAQVLIASLFITGMTAHKSHIYEHRYDISLYSDAEGNAVLLVDNAPLADVLLRNVTANNDALSLQMQTASYAPWPLKLTSVAERQEPHSGGVRPPLLHARESSSEPYEAAGGLLQNWLFDTEQAAASYDGHYTLLFDSADSDESALAIAELMMHIDDAPAATQEQILSTSGYTKMHAANPNESVCMESYIAVGTEIAEHTELALRDVYICHVDDTNAASGHLCANHSSAVQLVSNGQSELDSVSVTWPGTYGPRSVTVCFDGSEFFADTDRRSHRYEASVELHARNAGMRQASASWHAHTSRRHESALSAPASHLRRRAALAHSQFERLHGGALFARGDLERSLIAARRSNALSDHELQSASFAVNYGPDPVYNVSASDTLTMIIITAALIACVLVAFVAVIYVRSAGKAKSADLSARLEQHYIRHE